MATITVAQYKTAVRNRLDDTSFDGAYLTQFALDTNRELCNSERWRFMESTFVGVVTTNLVTYALPTDYQAAVDLALIDPDGSARYLNYMPFEAFDMAYPDPMQLTAATPSVWTSYGNNLTIGPAKPDQGYTLSLRYYKTPVATITDASTLDVPDEFSELIVLGMLKRALMTNDNYDQAQIIQQEIDEQKAAMKDRLMTRQYGDSIRMNVGRNSWQ